MANTRQTNKASSKETSNSEINFPCGNLELMLRQMRKFREKGDFYCEAMMKQLFKNDDFNCSAMMQKILGKEAGIFDFEEMRKKFESGEPFEIECKMMKKIFGKSLENSDEK